MNQKKRKKNIITAIIVVFITSITYLVFFLNFTFAQIDGVSMAPTLKDKSYGLLYKNSHQYKRGDIIAFASPDNPKTEYIKRIVALPGDNVIIQAGELYIKGIKIKEPYKKKTKREEKLDYSLEKSSGTSKIPDGKLFVLGDNRLHSRDSREFGFIDITMVKGKLIVDF